MKTELKRIQSPELSGHLRSFGLNPKDWDIWGSSEQSRQLLVRSRADESFAFLGTIKRAQKTWESMQLLSL